MSDTTPVASAETPASEGSLKAFLFAAVLWLPLAFFFWFMFRSAIVSAPLRVAVAIVGAWVPGLFSDVAQNYNELVYSILADASGVPGLPGAHFKVDLQVVNVLQYCYNLPVLIGLVMATPMSWARTFAQIFGGWLVLLPIQALGVVSDMLKTAAFDLGSAVSTALAAQGYPAVAGAAGDAASRNALAQLAAHGLKPEIVALMYQFGYLILPPVSAVFVWIVFNRRFIEALTGRGAEPPRAPAV
jgi:hypothetical protein